MEATKQNNLVYTIRDRCRVCYTCVRECPVKAIKIINGQAEIIAERCIACGNCTRVCSQGAKAFRDSTLNVFQLLDSGAEVIAIVAQALSLNFQRSKITGHLFTCCVNWDFQGSMKLRSVRTLSQLNIEN